MRAPRSPSESPAPAGAPINLGPLSRIPLGEGRVLIAAGIAVAVFRPRNGPIFATQPECPHRGGPLADGLVGGAVVICPLHAFKFDLASGRPLGNDCPALRTYAVETSAAGDALLHIDDLPASPATEVRCPR